MKLRTNFKSRSGPNIIVSILAIKMDLREKKVNYNWKTIYVGIIEGFFKTDVIADYATELMKFGSDDDFIRELA